MRIGPYELHAIETGRFALDGGAMFGSVPKTLWGKTNPADELNRIELAARALLVVGHGRTILVDTGLGNKFSEKLAGIYRVDYSRYDLQTSLRSAGVSAEDVTDVILTHLHFDHAGGATCRADGKSVPAFPNARYHVQKTHWEHALKPNEKDRASFMPDDFLPLMEAGVLELVDGEIELFPGISLMVTHGHTPAQQLPRISDGRNTLFYCCDLIPTAAHMRLPYIMGYDLQPLVTLEEKRQVLSRAAAEGWTLFFEHDPEVAAGKIRKAEKGYSLEPAWE